jgi:hypothetical protein
MHNSFEKEKEYTLEKCKIQIYESHIALGYMGLKICTCFPKRHATQS